MLESTPKGEMGLGVTAAVEGALGAGRAMGLWPRRLSEWGCAVA